jgi:hypothetical protein
MLDGNKGHFKRTLYRCLNAQVAEWVGGHYDVLETTYRRLCAGVPSVILAK